jgi:hypothetical protein
VIDPDERDQEPAQRVDGQTLEHGARLGHVAGSHRGDPADRTRRLAESCCHLRQSNRTVDATARMAFTRGWTRA